MTVMMEVSKETGKRKEQRGKKNGLDYFGPEKKITLFQSQNV